MTPDLSNPDTFVGPVLPSDTPCHDAWPNPWLHGITRWVLCTADGQYRDSPLPELAIPELPTTEDIRAIADELVPDEISLIPRGSEFQFGAGLVVGAAALAATVYVLVFPSETLRFVRELAR